MKRRWPQQLRLAAALEACPQQLRQAAALEACPQRLLQAELLKLNHQQQTLQLEACPQMQKKMAQKMRRAGTG